ncbi:MAG: DUF5689 domain-containing protein [Phocaeicola sp.]
MKRLNSIFLFLTMLFTVSFVSCVDDNDDTEAPFLTVSPTVLLFGNDGQPQAGSQNHFEVATNRSWIATVQDNKSWVTLSRTAGEGGAQIEVSIPEGINDEATILIQISNKVGVLKSETVTIKSGEVVESEVLYNETMGTTSISSPWPFVDTYEGWSKTGIGASEVTYSGNNATLRTSGLSNAGSYESASGPNVIFFGGAPATFVINKIALTANQTNLKLTFGGSRSSNSDGGYDNTFSIDNFEVALSANGTSWTNITYTKNEGDAEHPYWIYATANLTLKEAVSELYIKFTAKESSVYRLDDVTLATGNGGQEVDLEGGVTPDPEPTDALYSEGMGNLSITSPWPVVADYTAWNKAGSAAANVTYSGTNASLRSSGKASTGAYEGASGPNVIFFGGAPATFVINKIALTANQTKLKLNFGGSRSLSLGGGSYDNAFVSDNFEVALSANGTTWTNITYTKNNGDAADPYWIYATAEFTLKQAVSELYIKFTAKESSVFRLDDILLNVGNGGQEVDLEGGVTPDPEPSDAVVITIPELLGMIGSTAVVVDENNDRYFEAIVLSDVAGGNYTANNLVVATENATTGKNGITLYGSQVDPAKLGVTRGDKVKITLTKGLAKAQTYNGLNQVTGAAADAWATVEKVGTGTVNAITITLDQMNDFQAMPVNIANATTTAAGVWANSTGNLSHTLTVNGSNLTVFCKKGAVSLLDVPFQATTATITGLVSIYSNALQLVPRDAADVAAFAGSSEVPTLTVNPTSVNFAAAGGTQTVAVTVTNQGENTLTISQLSGILSATLVGNTITIVATENSETTAVNQDLTVSLSNGTNVVVPVTVAAKVSGDVTNFTMTAQQMVDGANGSVALGTNSYGSQVIADASTWYTWTSNGINFSGAKMCVAPASNGGGIQVQGNATNTANQGRITNVTALGTIQSITLVLRVLSTTTNAPNYNLYAGTTTNPGSSDSKIVMTDSNITEADDFKTYTHTYDFTAGNYSYFTIANDLVGALYIDAIEVSYK